MKRIFLAVVLCLLVAGPALADESTNVPMQFRLTSYIADAPPSGVTPLWHWTVGYNGKTYTMQIVKTELLSDSVMPQDVDEWVMPYKPNFTLAGDDQAIKAFTSA